MATRTSQISAPVAAETKELLEQFARAHGLKKGFLIEQALLHHVQALRELPADLVIPPRLVVPRAAGAEVLARLEAPGEPTEAMVALMAGEAGEGPDDR